jgi:hypothetical protein
MLSAERWASLEIRHLQLKVSKKGDWKTAGNTVRNGAPHLVFSPRNHNRIEPRFMWEDPEYFTVSQVPASDKHRQRVWSVTGLDE